MKAHQTDDAVIEEAREGVSQLATFTKLSFECVYFEETTRYQHGTFQSASIIFSIEKPAISLNMLSVSFSMSNYNVKLRLPRASYPIPETVTFVTATSTLTIYVGKKMVINTLNFNTQME